MNNNLISNCVCGNNVKFLSRIIYNIPIAECLDCGVIHQELAGYDDEKYYGFYKTDYHENFQKNRGTITYEERYTHDVKVSELRLEAYKDVIRPHQIGLDIGSSNSAFVHTANKLGYSCIGLEPGEHIGDNTVTFRGTLQTVDFENDYYDFVTMHDSIEHMIDVNFALEKVSRILKPNGVLILDLPDYFDVDGIHHWKKIEHLWFFTETQLVSILNKHGFAVDKTTKPIPGKLVFYTHKVPE
jgi:SAM-dependent methyltransferase